ncbi:unnamed protein product [Adineta steineri]|uniref:Uncharacterized protein n=1 Tax=Adineta steineri TaxID=433720 RepID=A0A818M0F1_9BILA|nr:unnamed protein product [Adineta steineri]CAF3580295.1 unnamed protein product [Adineta steineri]
MVTNVLPDANNITVTNRLSSCDNSTLNLTRTLYDLYSLYRNNLTSDVFFNISIINFNCTNETENYFKHIITFTHAVSIRIQILFASIYSDYLNANNYQLNGFKINQSTYFNLTSITTNNNAISDACSSADAANDPLCQTNSTNPICTILSNRWNFICSPTRMNNTQLQTPPIVSGLNAWQLGLVCALSVFFVLLLIIFFGYFYRRYTHSKQIALSRVNLYDDEILKQKTEIPQGRAFQKASTIVQPKHRNNTGISWIHKDFTINAAHINENGMNTKSLELHNQGTIIDRKNIFDLNLLQNSKSPNDISTRKIVPTIIISGSVSEKSLNQLKSTTEDNTSMDQSILNNSRTQLTKSQMNDVPLTDENLSDEDAWMSILDVVNAELAILNEQERIQILM